MLYLELRSEKKQYEDHCYILIITIVTYYGKGINKIAFSVSIMLLYLGFFSFLYSTRNSLVTH